LYDLKEYPIKYSFIGDFPTQLQNKI
jgi:hypothetical protein